MSKRKVTPTLAPDSPNKSLKKPRTDFSKYTLGSCKSKQYFSTEKDELEQDALEAERLTEINLLLDHITEDNALNIEKYLKKCVKEDKIGKKQNLRLASTCLQSVFQFIMENEASLTDGILNKLSNCFNAIKIEAFGPVKLNAFLEEFVIFTSRTNSISPLVGRIVCVLIKSLHKDQDLVHAMFHNILNTCRLDQDLLLALLEILDSVYHAGSDSSKAQLLLNTVFQWMPDSNVTETLPVFIRNKKRISIKWSAKNLERLLITVSIVQKYVPGMRMSVYKGIIEFIIFGQKSLREKVDYQHLEMAAIRRFTQELKNDSKRKREEISHAFCQAFVAVIHKHSLKAILNHFFVCLYLSALDSLDSTKEINKAFLNKVKNLFDLHLHAKDSPSLSKCMYKKKPVEDLKNIFIYRKLALTLSESVISIGLTNVCKFIMENYISDEISFHATDEPANSSEYFSQFVTINLSQLMLLPSGVDPTVVMNLINGCFVCLKQSVFIQQLTLLLEQKKIQNVFYLKHKEIEKLKKAIVNRLTGNFRYPKFKSVKLFKHLLQFSSADQGIRLLNTLGHILFNCKSDHLFDLVIYLTPASIFDSNTNASDEQQRLVVYGLLSILRSINSLPDATTNYAQQIKDNQPISELIIARLFRILTQVNFKNENTIIAELRSVSYQSFYGIIQLNLNLIEPIANIFLIQLKKVLVKTTDTEAHFDLRKCVSSFNLQLLEPVDVLLHCADLCRRSGMQLMDNNHMHAGYASLMEIKHMVAFVFRTYENRSAQELFETYKEQTIKVLEQSMPVKTMLVMHKLVMGLIDVLIEYTVNDEHYMKILKMLDHYEKTSSLISSDIETLMTTTIPTSTSSTSKTFKRKSEKPLGSALKAIHKKFRTSNKDKENAQVTVNPQQHTTSSSKLTRQPFADLTNHTKPLDITQNAPELTDKSYINIQFTYVPRISHSCCVRMLEFIQCSSGQGQANIFGLFSDQLTRNSLINLMTSQKFVDYVVKIIDKKLKPLLAASESGQAINVRFPGVYDPESYGSEKFFQFLSKIWNNMCQRVNGTINASGESIFTPFVRQNFSQGFFVKTQKFIGFCQMIWSIVQKSFKSSAFELVHAERQMYSPDLSEIGHIDTNILKEKRNAYRRLCWKFLLNCSRTVKLHLSPTGLRQVYASRCCTSMLNLMLEIMKTVDLTSQEYDVIYTWLRSLAMMPAIGEADTYKLVIELLVYVEKKSTTQAILIKYLMMDYQQHMKFMMAEDLSNEEEMHNITDMVTQFNLVNHLNENEYQKLVLGKLVDLLADFKWMVSNSIDLNSSHILEVIVKQLNPVTITIGNAVESIFRLESVGLVVNVLIMFYEFMTFLFQSDLILKMTSDEADFVKGLIESITNNIQGPLLNEWKVIEEFIINDEESHGDKAGIDDIKRFAKYKSIIANLEQAIQTFEMVLKKVHEKHRDVDILSSYTIYVDSLDLSFSSKLTRTVSISEISNYYSNIGQFSAPPESREIAAEF